MGTFRWFLCSSWTCATSHCAPGNAFRASAMAVFGHKQRTGHYDATPGHFILDPIGSQRYTRYEIASTNAGTYDRYDVYGRTNCPNNDHAGSNSSSFATL